MSEMFEVPSTSSSSQSIVSSLHSLYRFVDKPASDDQSKNSIEWIIDLFKKFHSTLGSVDHASMFQLNKSELSTFQLSMTQMSSVCWYPEYASAILTLESSMEGYTDLVIIGCDHWVFSPRLLPGGQSEHVAESKDYLVSSCGSLRIEEMVEFFENIDIKLQKRLTKEARSAANGKGHQMTPAFLRSVVIDVVKHDDDSKSEPRGATTDVGMHTGSRRRCTTWPLFLAVLDRYINRNNNSPLLTSKIMMRFDLYTFDAVMECFSVADITSIEQLDTLFHILSSASERALKLSALASRHNLRSDLPIIKEEICSRRRELDRYYGEFSERINLRYKIDIFNFYSRSPQLNDPTIVKVADNVYSEERVMSNILLNIGLIDGFKLDSLLKGASFRSLLEYLESDNFRDAKKHPIMTALLLKTIEAVFYQKAALLDEAMEQMSMDELECMEKITLKYSSVLDAWIMNRDWQGSWFVDLRSVEMVVHWTACCLVHKSLCITYPLLNEYSVPLSYREMKHLVLTDGESIDATMLVAGYLRKFNQNPSNDIFNPERQSPTIDFASRFASSSSTILVSYNEETTYIEAKKKDYMTLINERKIQLEQLRSKLLTNEASLRKHELRLQEVYHHSTEYHTLQSSISSCNGEIANLKNQISITNKAPAFIQSPLPSSKREALVVLFFLRMPTDIDLWSKMVIASKSMLLQRGRKTRFDAYPQFLATIVNSAVPLSWASYYKSIRTSTSVGDKNMIYYPPNLKVPFTFGHSLVDEIYSPQIFLPDVSSRFITNTTHNPFLASNQWASKIYTETIDRKVDFCLWNPVHPTGPSSRGNDPYAAYDSLPPDLSKSQQIAVISLRSYPHAQIRKVALLLSDTSIPIDNKVTATSIRMALFNIGDLSDMDKPKQLLRRDMELGASESIHCSLQKWRDIIANNKVHIGKIDILSDIFFLMSHESTAFQNISMEFCQVVEEWLQGNLDELKKDSITAGQIESIEIDNVRLLGYALLCLPLHKTGLRNAAVSLKALSLLTQFHNGFSSIVFVNDIAQMKIKIYSRICGCSRSLFENVSASMDEHLTGAIRKVIESCPPSLPWRAIKGFCYQASIKGKVSYSINILDGCVLVDGLPLGLLPSSIVAHDLYRRTFGQNNFKVGLMAGMFRTNSQIKGHFYEFSMAANDRDLVVKELVIDDGVVLSLLLLIDYNATSLWPSDLPVRLKEMHSHWYNPSERCLYIGPIAFQERMVYGFIAFEESTAYHIPRPIEKTIFIIKETRCKNDQFMVLEDDNQVMNALIKFEDRQYIHVLKESTGCIKFELARYGLSFRIVNGSAVSVDMTEYKLSSSQQIAGLLPHFTDYLVLEPICTRSLLNWVVLIPDGHVDMVMGMPKVVVRSKYDDIIGYFKYQVHRLLNHLMHDSILSGLHLSAIYAAAGSLLPDIRIKMTGSETAFGILRQCLINRPYSSEESSKMQSIYRLGWREPALVALCSKYIDFSQQLDFLYRYDALDHDIDSNEYFNDARSASKLITANEFHRNFRRELADTDYNQIHGDTMPVKPTIVQDCNNIHQRHNFKEDFTMKNTCNFKLQYVESVAFPVDMSGVGTMEQEMYDELKSSYDLFLKTPGFALDPAVDYLQWLTAIMDMLPGIIRRKEKAIYVELSTTTAYSSEFAIFVASNRAPMITRSDLLKIALDKNLLFKFNPFIEDVKQVQRAIIRLLELFVLEETLSRAREYLVGGDNKLFIQEIDNRHRDWDSTANVDWLVFEVEGRLKIRSKQYLVAQHLIDNPGSICQLNMGEGKTRVILPMLIMYYTRNKDRPIYVNLLRQILREASDYLQKYLSFSQLHIVTLELPFQRDVALTEKRVRIIDSMLSLTRSYRCFITVSPEFRLSLMLHSIEVDYECRREVGYGSLLKSLLLKMKTAVNIFDESDRLLSHIFQLVYTAGDVSPLSDLEARLIVVQALFKAVNADEIKTILNSDGFAAIEERKHVGFSMGAFTSIRLLYDANTNDLQSKRELFKRKLLGVLIQNPVRELRWMKNTEHKTVIESLVFEQHVDMHSRELFSDTKWAQLTCLRGFLGGGLFEYALSLRESVTFGIDERRTKRIAVPYQAADLPTEKSEYSNPDLTLFLTSIAYYAKGLSKDQLRDSFRLLLKSNPSEQEQRYGSWITSIAEGLNISELNMIGSINMIDLNNPTQLSLLHEKFRYHVEVINFWLEKDVFPRDTAQYDKRIVGSAFDVAVGDHNIGFSGTKDNHRLIPWQVKQNEPDIDSLLATDGMMIYKIVENTILYKTLNASRQTCVELLDIVLDINADALIDTGALLVGINNEDAAKYLVNNSSFQHRGVYYFKDMWMVMDRETRLSTEASRSSITSRESLIIYDEARTRGVDLKSKRDAVAVVTLGPKLTKANFMQGVGRLRAFGNNQKIVIAMTKEIEREILHLEGPDGCEYSSVLKWIMRNTVEFNTVGLVTYSRNAIQFAKSSDDDDRRNSVLDEDWTLETLYSKGRRSEALVGIIQSASTGISDFFRNRILDQVFRYGSEHMVSAVPSNNDQCEREMQMEEQEEQEVEVERASLGAVDEAIWSYSTVSNISSATALPVTISSFNDKLKEMNHLLSNIKWPLNLYGTSNFFKCIDNLKYARLIDAMLVFSDCVVVLSDMESDGILGTLHDLPNTSIAFINLKDLEAKELPQMALGRVNMISKLPLLTAMKLFNGDVNYCSTLSSEINRLCSKEVEKAIVENVQERGNSRLWKFSDLEEVLDRMNY